MDPMRKAINAAEEDERKADEVRAMREQAERIEAKLDRVIGLAAEPAKPSRAK